MNWPPTPTTRPAAAARDPGGACHLWPLSGAGRRGNAMTRAGCSELFEPAKDLGLLGGEPLGRETPRPRLRPCCERRPSHEINSKSDRHASRARCGWDGRARERLRSSCASTAACPDGCRQQPINEPHGCFLR